jgi:hypothetical protein
MDADEFASSRARLGMDAQANAIPEGFNRFAQVARAVRS